MVRSPIPPLPPAVGVGGLRPPVGAGSSARGNETTARQDFGLVDRIVGNSDTSSFPNFDSAGAGPPVVGNEHTARRDPDTGPISNLDTVGAGTSVFGNEHTARHDPGISSFSNSDAVGAGTPVIGNKHTTRHNSGISSFPNCDAVGAGPPATGNDLTARQTLDAHLQPATHPPSPFFRELCEADGWEEGLISLEERRFKAQSKWRRAWRFFHQFCVSKSYEVAFIINPSTNIQKVLSEFALYLRPILRNSPRTPAQLVSNVKSSLQLFHPCLANDKTALRSIQKLLSRDTPLDTPPMYTNIWNINNLLRWTQLTAQRAANDPELHQTRTLMLVLAYTCCRREELTKLKWDRIEWPSSVLEGTPDRAVLSVKQKQHQDVYHQKSVFNEGTPNYSPFLALRAHRLNVDAAAPRLSPLPYSDLTNVWINFTTGQPLNQQRIAERIAAAFREMGLSSDFRPYSIKHAAISYLRLKRHVSLRVLNAHVGWSSGSTVADRYYVKPILDGSDDFTLVAAWWQPLEGGHGHSIDKCTLDPIP
ncbi:hypothetical protein BLNAU_4963 [Blattamonas nauphoetae]|uniref:Tyr recombinase domain-containing protein n=1 Tax=Blattamonas nauphoetae TaxID=2049346 RepID=A0ABQ9Y8N9_9EUKA|nr:hypothetical protein BLNAU_4963 [Blattamonas nauphoetae]